MRCGRSTNGSTCSEVWIAMIWHFVVFTARASPSWMETKKAPTADLAVLGAFVFGMDGDTLERLRRRADFMIRSGVDVMQTTYLTPLPGTRLFDRLRGEGRLLYDGFPRDWDHYDMTEVTHFPQHMVPETLAQAMCECNKRMYARPVLIRKAMRTFLETRNLR